MSGGERIRKYVLDHLSTAAWRSTRQIRDPRGHWSTNTVRNTLRDLKDDGLIEGRTVPHEKPHMIIAEYRRKKVDA